MSSTIKNIIGYGLGQGMDITKGSTINYLTDLFQKTANISAGNDVLVKQYLAKSGTLPKFAGINEKEQMAIFASLSGITGDEAETSTQLERMSQSMFDLTP